MAVIALTPEQIVEKLNSDKEFGIRFVVENQPSIVLDRIKKAGSEKVDTVEKAIPYLNELLTANPEKAKEILNGIPYDNTNENWTGKLASFLPSEVSTVTPTTDSTGAPLMTTRSGSLWSGILTGVGSLATAIGGALGGAPVGSTPLTPAQLEAMRQEELRRAEEERKRQQRNLVIGVVSALALIIVFALIYSKNKKKS